MYVVEVIDNWLLSVSGSASILPSASSTQPTSTPHESIGADSHVDSRLHPIDASASHVTPAVQSVYATRFISSSMYVQGTSSISGGDLAWTYSVVSDVPQFSQTASIVGTHPSYQPSYSSAVVLQQSTAAHTAVTDVTPTEPSVHASDFNIHSSIPNTITLSSSEAFSAGGAETTVQLTGMTPALPSSPSLEHTASIINQHPTAMYSNALGEMASVVTAADHESSIQSSPSYVARSEIDVFSKMLTLMSSSTTVNGQTKVTSPVIVSASTAYDGHAVSSQLTPGDEYSSSKPMFLSTTENVVSTPISTYSQYNTDIHVTPAYSDAFNDLPSVSYQTGSMIMATVVMSHGTIQPSSAITATDEALVTSIELPPHTTVFGDSSGVLDVSDASSSLSYDDHRTSRFASVRTSTRTSIVDAGSIYTVASPTFASAARTTIEAVSSALWPSTELTYSGIVGVSQTRHDQTATIMPSPLPSAGSQTTTTIMPSPLPSVLSQTTTSLQHTQLLTTLYVNKSSPIYDVSRYTVTSPDITLTTRPAIETTSYAPWNSIEYTTNIPVLSSTIPNAGNSETFQGAFDETASIMPSSLIHVPTGIPEDTTFVHIQMVSAFSPNPSSSSQTGSTSVSAYTSSHALPSASVAQLNQSFVSFHDSATISHTAVANLGTSLYDQYLTVTPSFVSDSMYPERSAEDDAITSLHDDYLTITPVFVSDTIYDTRSALVGPSTSLFDQHLTVSPPFTSDTSYPSLSAEADLSSSMYDPYLTVTPSFYGTSIYPESSSTGDQSSPFSDQYLTVTPSLGSDAIYLKSSPMGDVSTSANDPYPTVTPSLVSNTIYPEGTTSGDYSTSMYDSHLTVMPSVGSGTIYPKSSAVNDLSPSMYDPILTVTQSLVSEPTFPESSSGGEISSSMTDQYSTVVPSLGIDIPYHSSSSVEDDFVTSTYGKFSTATPSLDSDIIFPESFPIDGLVTSMREGYSTVTPSLSYVSATVTTAAESDASITDSTGGRFTTVTTVSSPIDHGSSVSSIPVYSLSSSLQESIDGSATIMTWTSTPSSMFPRSATQSVSESGQWSFVATATTSLPLATSVPDVTTGISSSLQTTASLPLTTSVPDVTTGISSSLQTTASLSLTSSLPDATTGISSSLQTTASLSMTPSLPDATTGISSSLQTTASLPLTTSVPGVTTGISSSLQTTASLSMTSSLPDATTRISSSLPASAISSQVWMINVECTHVCMSRHRPELHARHMAFAHGSLESPRDIRVSLCTVMHGYGTRLNVVIHACIVPLSV